MMSHEMTKLHVASDSKCPLTAFAKHHVRPDALQNFEALAQRIRATQKERFVGHLSSELIWPLSSSDENECVSIFRHDLHEHLKQFLGSKECQELRTEARMYTFPEHPPEYAFHHLEHFF